jgi:Zn-dependent membrane protease YugP
MHPVVFLLPTAALILGPRLWVHHVLRKHNRVDERVTKTGGELARELLDRHELVGVKVEPTDIGDHYDPESKTVRLARDKLDRRSLTAIVTAAHEVGHALQDASGYRPYLWRKHLVKIARVTGQAGTVMLLAVPAAALMTRNPIPPIAVGATALTVLGTGVAAQLAALPTEWDASFERALPLLRDGYIEENQVDDVRTMLTACSLTYVASSLAAILHVWPWLPRGPVMLAHPGVALRRGDNDGKALDATHDRRPISPPRRPGGRPVRGASARFAARIAKPLFRGWLGYKRAVASIR